jgi:iron complex outermembrane recepter protein
MTIETEEPVTLVLQEGVDLNEVVVVGSRGQSRTLLTSPVPVDNINAAELLASGQTTVEQMINYKVPSYNSSNQTISDATAHFDPSELRNLGPSRTLVLVNGKRKNQSALVYVNDTPGKGEVGTDMKSIPASAIKRIEVLRDGASALYGSDAIAGVVNIILKDATSGSVDLTSGITTAGDGFNYGADINKGFKIGQGVLNLTGSFFHQDETNRAGEPGNDALFGVTSADAPWLIENPDMGMTIGQPRYDKYSGSLNFSLPYAADKGEFYAFGGYTKRLGTSFALYRTPYWIPTDFGLLTPAGETYQGFQPTFETDINDSYLTIGNRYDINGWKTDVSLTTGNNSVDYTIGNTINVSLGANSPTEFNAGAYRFGHILGNVDVSKNLTEKIALTLGTEIRRESFAVEAGQEESYINGGAQSFPGLQPSNALEATRSNTGAYLGLDWDATKSFLIGGAVRYENYSDFGSNLSWKVQARQLFNGDKGVIRGSVSTGFRAPSLHQIYLSNVQTLVSGGTISNQGTFNNVSPVIRSLGVPALDAETAFNISAGVTYKLSDNFSLSADYYNVAIDNRVLFTGEIGADGDNTTINPVEQILIDNSVTSIKFFVNALDTRTQGFDLILNYDNISVGSGNINLVLATNYNKTEIVGSINAPGVLATEGYDIFNRKEQSRVISARPNFKSTFGINYKIGDFAVILNNTYFGEVTWQHATDATKDQTFGARVITDLLLNYKINNRIRANLTVNNLFDVYPDVIDNKGDVVTDLGGRFKYPWEVNQFGFNGTTVRLGLNISL